MPDWLWKYISGIYKSIDYIITKLNNSWRLFPYKGLLEDFGIFLSKDSTLEAINTTLIATAGETVQLWCISLACQQVNLHWKYSKIMNANIGRVSSVKDNEVIRVSSSVTFTMSSFLNKSRITCKAVDTLGDNKTFYTQLVVSGEVSSL